MNEQSKAIELASQHDDEGAWDSLTSGDWMIEASTELRRLDAENAAFKLQLKSIYEDWLEACKERDALRAQLAQNKPVGYLFKAGHPGMWEFSIYPDAKTDVKPTPVYEAPYCISSAPQQAQGKVTITTNENGDCVAVTRNDAEGKITDVLWERAAQQAPADEREAFERDLLKRNLITTSLLVEISGKNNYCDLAIQQRWESWQARATLTATKDNNNA